MVKKRFNGEKKENGNKKRKMKIKKEMVKLNDEKKRK